MAAAVTAQSEVASELLQKLSIDSQPKGVEVQDVGKKFGSIGSNTKVNGFAKPFIRATPTPPIQDFTNMSAYYAPQGYPSATYYYRGYDGSINEWNDYRYMNRDLADMQNGFQQQNLSSGAGHDEGYMSRLHQNSQIYGQYGNTYGSGLGYTSNYYNNSKTGWSYAYQPVGSKYTPKGQGKGFFRYGNQLNKDRLNEMSKGPRAGGAFKNELPFGSFKLAVKGQGLPGDVNNIEEKDNVPVCPAKEQYNKEDFPENFLEAKFFVIKSYSEDDVHRSVKYSVWSSTPNGNKKLNEAYQEAQAKSGDCPVFLLFSVNGSGQFVGLAEMVGPVDFNKTVDFWQQDKWIGCFPVKWHIVKDVPNSLLKHIKLQYNENKPVTNSRDTQEVYVEQGNEVLKIFKLHSSKTSILDDFVFYEGRESTMQEKKSKRLQYQNQVKDTKEAKDFASESNGDVKVDKNLDEVSSLVQSKATAVDC